MSDIEKDSEDNEKPKKKKSEDNDKPKKKKKSEDKEDEEEKKPRENKIPFNNAPRKPSGKKSFSLANFKKTVGNDSAEEKPLEWIPCSKAFQEETGLPGYAKGYVGLARGFSNTGKSTSVMEAAVSAQKMGILPILIDTENNMGRERLTKMGFDWGDPNDEDTHFYIEVDNDYLLDRYGKKKNSTITEASIEDMADCIHDILNMQDQGLLPFDLLFVIDSLGTLDCIRTINAHDKGSSDNNMWNAGAFERAFKGILNNRIPSSRKKSKTYTNTIIAVQKIWIDSMGAGVVKHKGGEAFFYAARLIFHHGGIAAHGTRAVSATSKKKNVTFGIESKISVVKNQVDGDLGGIAMEGKLVSTPHGFISAEKEAIDRYKKEHIQFFRDALGETDISPDTLGTKYTEIKENGDQEVGYDSLKDNLDMLEDND